MALAGTLGRLNTAFVTLLAVELAVSACARWPQPFLSRSENPSSALSSVKIHPTVNSAVCHENESSYARRVRASSWSALDVAVVASSVASAFIADQPPGLVTALRAVRVLRIFGKVAWGV